MMKQAMFISASTILLLLVSVPTALAQAEAYEVSHDVVSHDSMQEIQVWAPQADGAFPVVYAAHGTGGSGKDWDVIGPALAQRGVVVFATDYHSTDYQTGR